MTVKQSLDFVKGSVAKKDFVPALTHLQIKDGFVYGYNGAMSLGSPIDLDFETCPKAIEFIKAINACEEDAALTLTKAGTLKVKSGKLTTHVPCSPEPLPIDKPTGNITALNGKLLPALKQVAPFIAQDASRPWARGVYFKNDLANATNNIALIQTWVGFSFPVEIVLPEPAVKELIRIKEEPLGVILNENVITFVYGGGRWLTTALFDPQWPDISPVLDKDVSAVPFPDGFFEALIKLSPFCDESRSVYFEEGFISTGTTPESTTLGFAGLPAGARYNIDQLLNLKDRVTKIDFTVYPDPCIFYGENSRGAVMGMLR